MGIGAVEDSRLPIVIALLHPVFDSGYDITRLINLVVRGIQVDGISVTAVCPQIFPQSSGILADQPVGGLQDSSRRSVILFEPNSPATGEILCEALDVFDPRTAPSIDGLVVVAHHHQVVVVTGK